MGLAGAPQAPEDLDCPPEQWICLDLICTRDADYFSDPGECVCDRSRPVSEADCDEDLRFVCDHLDPSVGERGLTSCACIDPNLGPWDACWTNNPSHFNVLAGVHCGCAVVVIK